MNFVWSRQRRFAIPVGIAILLVVTLTAGALFAASAPPQSQPAAPPEPAPERLSIQTSNHQKEIDLPPIAKEPPKHPNLDSNLNRLVAEAATGARQDVVSQPNTTDRAGGSSGAATEPALVTFYIEPAQVGNVRTYLEDKGVFVRNVGEDYIEAHVPPLLLPEASRRPGVRRVDTVIPPRPAQSQTSAISQGVGLHGADAWHDAGYRGQSVKVGVIDSGFEGFSRLQGSELPASVTARCYFYDSLRPTSRLVDCEVDGDDHGTVVAETLVDVAPGVEIYIANPISDGDLRNAVDWMAGQGVQVINYSLGDIPDGPGDGTSPFSDSPLRTIDAAVSSGITWVTAAGNSAGQVWYGAANFHYLNRSENDAQFHHWSSDDPINSFMAPEGSSIIAFMRWDDTWGAADCDLDLALWNDHPITGRPQLVGADTRIQDGGPESIPFALIPHGEVVSGTGGRYFLTISKDNPSSCPDDPAWIQLIAWIDDELQYYSPGHHMGNPEESRNTGQLAVGATHYWDTNSIASYSSRGPALDGRTKPDITGIACGQSAVYPPVAFPDGNRCWFEGTSQAAPHVAGLAALVRQRFPDYTPAQTVDYLQRNASERGISGKDNTWGHGLAALPAPEAAPAPAPGPGVPPTARPGVAPTANIAVRAGDNSDEVVLSWDAVPGATHYRIGYVNMEVDYHLAKASCTEEWINAFVYVDENARNIPVANGRAEYTIRRLSPGARHAFTVLTSNNFVDSGGGGSVTSEFFWPSNPRWRFLDGRKTLPAGLTLPSGECAP